MTPTTPESPPAGVPIRIRAQARDGRTLVRVLMTHPMENGLRRDAAGRTVPAWHIREVVVARNGAEVLRAQWGPSVAQDPTLQFTLRGGQPGDRLQVAWTDSRGASRRDEVRVEA